MKNVLCIVFLLFLCSTYLFCFQDGEKLTFDIKYGMVTAGTAILEVKTIQHNNRPSWKITSNASTNGFFDKLFKVRDYIESIWDKETQVSYKFTKLLQEGGYRQHRIHTYYPNENYTIYSRYRYKQKFFKNTRIDIPSKTQDVFSAFYYSRLQKLEVGKPLQINVTTDGKNHLAKVLVLRKETINTIFGKKECLVIKPDLIGEAIFKQSGEILIWITNDDYKIPVLMESKVIFGSFKAVLSKAENVQLKVINE
ncbi:MAG: DUF3108 domain-containing protein [Candidatus Cloacimonetes bacterium]|nr:DUF3108 domain-containing protein [Candidatus Cloacimonadota bacterium]HPM00777.1 DUF3108 domain-containing protein [Candidatus Cloacimonadota bacterium]